MGDLLKSLKILLKRNGSSMLSVSRILSCSQKFLYEEDMYIFGTY